MQYVGFDIHKRYTFYTQMDATGQIERQGKLQNSREALAGFFGAIDEPARLALVGRHGQGSQWTSHHHRGTSEGFVHPYHGPQSSSTYF